MPAVPTHDDATADVARAKAKVRYAYAGDGVVERTGPALGNAFSDQLLHGSDLARATNQDGTMPDDLAQAAYDCIHGRFNDEQWKGVFGPEIPVGDEATPSSDSSLTRGATPTQVVGRNSGAGRRRDPAGM